MRSKHSWAIMVIMVLVFIGVLQQFLHNPTGFLAPIIIVLVFLYFWKFPWRRGAGWKGNNPLTRFRESRMYSQRFSKPKQKAKTKPRSGNGLHRFKVIDGKKKNTDRKFH